jgi:Methane oxygenase PmoA
VRVSDEIQNKTGNGVITSVDGKVAKAPAKDNLPMWGYPAAWHDYSGTVGGKPVGVAIFDDPKNAPQAAWHTRAYGLMAANPFGRNGSQFPALKGKTDLVKLAKGEHLKLRYGLYVHTGDATTGKVADAFSAFAK